MVNLYCMLADTWLSSTRHAQALQAGHHSCSSDHTSNSAIHCYPGRTLLTSCPWSLLPVQPAMPDAALQEAVKASRIKPTTAKSAARLSSHPGRRLPVCSGYPATDVLFGCEAGTDAMQPVILLRMFASAISASLVSGEEGLSTSCWRARCRGVTFKDPWVRSTDG